MTVYQVIHAKGLEDYYQIKKDAGTYRRRSPVEIQEAKYRYMDEADFLSEFSYKDSAQNTTMQFYLEGIHCLACLWLIEKLPFFVSGVESAKLDLEKSVVTVAINSQGRFSLVANEFNQLGYRPHPLKGSQAAHDLKRKEDRAALLKIGIAAAGTSNIMIYAVSIYGGASDIYAQVFNALTVLFGIPVLTYCASPFYRNAMSAIKNKTLSIDIPISIALIAGLFMGVFNLVIGVTENYFDSLTMLVFLLLLSRYFLKKIQQNALSSKELHYFYHNDSVQRATDDSFENFQEVHPKYLNSDDIIKVSPGNFIPIDGQIIKGNSSINSALLTGESRAIKVDVGANVFAGTQNLSDTLLIKTIHVGEETRLGKILKSVEAGWSAKAPIVELTDQLSQRFIFSVFILTAILFAWKFYTQGLHLAIEQSLTLLIVTCPCALALATPLAFTRALTKAAEQGILIKSDLVLQKLTDIKTIFLDKTGTITHGQMRIVDFKQVHDTHSNLFDVILSLEILSKHPVAKALVEFAKENNGSKYKVENFDEQIGVGVSGNLFGHHYEIKKQAIYQDQKLIANFKLDDTIRLDSPAALKNLHSLGLNLRLLSGDQKDNVLNVAKSVGLSQGQVFSELSPEEKTDILKNTKNAMMVGDGANDAIALTHAHVGVAVLGAMDISLRAADIYLTTPGLGAIEKVITLARESMSVIKRNLVLSLAYNFLSVIAVFMGLISPLVAAVIMPLSSLTVLLSTVIGTSKLRALWK